MRALPACSVRRSELVPCGHLVRAAGDDRIQAMEHSWKRRSRIAPKAAARHGRRRGGMTLLLNRRSMANPAGRATLWPCASGCHRAEPAHQQRK
jgi:hypothetical protein